MCRYVTYIQTKGIAHNQSGLVENACAKEVYLSIWTAVALSMKADETMNSRGHMPKEKYKEVFGIIRHVLVQGIGNWTAG